MPGLMIQNSLLSTAPHLCLQVLECFCFVHLIAFFAIDGDGSAFEIRL